MNGFGDVSQRDSEIWFEDGNVILRADAKVSFRVHRGILSHNSEVFAGMFSVTQPLDTPQMDGCPLIDLHDPVSDVRHLLNALYNRNYFVKGTLTSFEVLRSLLRMGTKYLISHIRDDVVSHLTILYPSTLTDLRDMQQHKLKALYPSKSHAIEAVSMARDHEVPIILPTALYYCCELSVTEILDGVSSSDADDNCSAHFCLSLEDQRLCLIARDKLLKARLVDVDYWFHTTCPDEDSGCDSQKDCARVLTWYHSEMRFASYWQNCNVFTDVPLTEQHEIDRKCDLDLQLCDVCREEWKDAEAYGYTQLWTGLPKTFGFSSWGALRTLQDGQGNP